MLHNVTYFLHEKKQINALCSFSSDKIASNDSDRYQYAPSFTPRKETLCPDYQTFGFGLV